jgi:hypothetical protein
MHLCYSKLLNGPFYSSKWTALALKATHPKRRMAGCNNNGWDCQPKCDSLTVRAWRAHGSREWGLRPKSRMFFEASTRAYIQQPPQSPQPVSDRLAKPPSDFAARTPHIHHQCALAGSFRGLGTAGRVLSCRPYFFTSTWTSPVHLLSSYTMEFWYEMALSWW